MVPEDDGRFHSAGRPGRFALPFRKVSSETGSRRYRKMHVTGSWACVVLLVVAVTRFVTADQPKPSSGESDSLDVALTRKGYERIPLRVVSEQDSSFLVVLACGKQPLKLVLDTGSTITILDAATAFLPLSSTAETHVRIREISNVSWVPAVVLKARLRHDRHDGGRAYQMNEPQ